MGLLAACFGLALAPQAPAGEVEFPGWNVIVIVLDDLGIDKLSFYAPELDPSGPTPECGVIPPPGRKAFPCTPTLQRLRDEGVLFTNAYTHPSCTPTRAAILTGRYPNRTGMGVALNDALICGDGVPCDGPESLADEEIFLPELLRDAPEASAYEIARGAFGKWHLSYVLGDECHAVRNGFEIFQGNMGNGNQSQVGPDHFDWMDTTSIVAPDGGCQLITVERTANIRTCFDNNTWDAAVTRRRARRWIEAQIAARRPYFAYVSFNPPHSVQQVPPVCLLSDERLAALDALGLATTGAVPTSSEIGTLDERRLAIYDATVEALDRQIELLLEGLEDTMVFVIGDNGTPDSFTDIPPSPFPSCRGKRTVYQLGVRVPLIVSGPVISPGDRGSTSDGLVDSVDLWRTAANLLGVSDREINAFLETQENPPKIDSRSFLPLLIDPMGPSARRRSYAEVFFPNSGGTLPFEPVTWLRMATDGQYKLVRKVFDVEWIDGQPQGGTVVEELFHIAVDPWETNPICAPAPSPRACESSCPPPACYAPSNPSCGDRTCSDPELCCGQPCPPPPGHPASLAYRRLRRHLEAVAASR